MINKEMRVFGRKRSKPGKGRIHLCLEKLRRNSAALYTLYMSVKFVIFISLVLAHLIICITLQNSHKGVAQVRVTVIRKNDVDRCYGLCQGSCFSGENNNNI
jgi:hypothetical protein